MSFLIVVVALLGGIGCGMESPTAPPPPVTVGLDQDFELAPGQTGILGDSGLSVVFDRVGNDSRCAVDVTCVWEGDAAVMVTGSRAGQDMGRFELHTSTQMGTREARYGDFLIRMQNLTPQPRSTDRIKAEAYRLVLRVTR